VAAHAFRVFIDQKGGCQITQLFPALSYVVDAIYVLKFEMQFVEKMPCGNHSQ
jgi:hypothetical protein